VKDSAACGSTAGAIAADGTSTSTGNTTCWTFAQTASLSSLANQTFALNQSATAISQMTVADQSTPTITSANDIRIKIATSTVRMLYDTTDTAAIFGGTASGKVSGTVSYEGGGSVLVIDVTSNFAASDTLTISGLSYTTFSATNTAAVALSLYTDGASDVVANSSDDKTVTITGSLAVQNHTLSQTTDNIQFPSATDVRLFRFKLTPTGESMSVTNTTLSLLGVNGIISADLTNLRLYQDTNSDGDYDASDAQVGGSPLLTLTGQTGTIVFSTAYTSSTTRDYVFIADVANIRPGDQMRLSLGSTAITAIGALTSGTVPPTYNVSSIQHIKNGAGSSGSAIGGDAPEGQGIRGGGGNGGGNAIDTDTGGTSLGDSVGFRAPTANGTPQGAWTTGGNGYNSDGAYATAASTNLRHTYGTFGFSVPTTNTITGIEVKVEGSGTTAAGSIDVKLSWDGGSSLTTLKNTGTLTGTDAIYTLGSPSDTWGRSWTPAEFNNGNFTIEVIAQPSSNTVQIDAIRVRVYHIATGGGGGGGVEVLLPIPAKYAYAPRVGGRLKESLSEIFANLANLANPRAAVMFYRT